MWHARGKQTYIHGFVGKPEGKTPLGRHRHRREDNIKKDLKGLGCIDLDWINLAQDTTNFRVVVNTVIKLRIPQNADKFLTS
jgi:hypothetical protein